MTIRNTRDAIGRLFFMNEINEIKLPPVPICFLFCVTTCEPDRINLHADGKHTGICQLVD